MTLTATENRNFADRNLSVRRSAYSPRIAASDVRATETTEGKSVPEQDRTTETLKADYLAHDTRNWLTVLQVYCDLLRTSGAVAHGYEKWINELSSAVERGHGLVASLLASVHIPGPVSGPCANSYANLGAAHGTKPSALEPAPASYPAPAIASPPWNVTDAIARRVPMLERLAGSNIHLDLNAPAEVATTALSESAFERILHNLVANAIEAMPKGGSLKIALHRHEAARASKTMLLCVSDTGAGIAPGRLPHIFKPGVSGKKTSGTRQKHGFGLAIVRELTESAGGSVRVRSHPGKGSRFEVELPCI